MLNFEAGDVARKMAVLEKGDAFQDICPLSRCSLTMMRVVEAEVRGRQSHQ